MILIFGLGNQGKEYQKTRHNFGHILVEKLIEKDLFTNDVLLKINDGFMNESGVSLNKLVSYYKIEPKNILIIHDDLDIEFSEMKLDFNRSSAGHKGVQSVIDNLVTQEFYRLRLGIGKSETLPGEKYVLEKFNQVEESEIDNIIDKAVDLLVKSDLLKDKIK
ncbi:MAG: Peptidyl-tRNA hydrolase [Berkelbacteria bacterium GW2011_GWA2_35_9]|uniref:Peptidyl-tRNA hydrolase n=1 Tax=Berkelbacteria bacterium GW2011_GWA2_35_9 TaxID=1618333 RepID=A0A0G0DK54_9BACT|nr:MAG: Peptidyl-tRNA hydrolase [Berkelbacteria bacterium GW2011_GWA2_35_9]